MTSDEYKIGFWEHGTLHVVSIDLECLRKALEPSAFQTREFGHGFKDKESCPIETPYPKPALLLFEDAYFLVLVGNPRKVEDILEIRP
jgi:hypothetical protein